MAVDGQRNTWQKAAVEAALGDSDDFLSAQTLHARMKSAGSPIGLATVYRTLNDLVERGRADVLPNGTEQLFRSCGTRHHHHLVCVDCGKAVEIEAPIEDWVSEVAREHGFADVQHVVDLRGVCADCQRLRADGVRDALAAASTR